MKGCYSKTLSRKYTHRNACWIERIFMALEYGSTSRKNATTSLL